MANFKDRLLDVIKEKQTEIFTERELIKKLNAFSVFEKRQIAQGLTELIADGELFAVEAGVYKVMNKENLIKGVLKGNRRGFAFLIREDKGADLFVPNKGLNGAFHKDTVYAKIVSGDEAEVVSIITRNTQNIVGTLERNGRNGFVIPADDGYFNDLFVLNTDVPTNSKVVAKIISYADDRNPHAKILEVLGKKGEIDTEVLAILRSYGFSEVFPENIINDAERLTELSDNVRIDYSKLPTITIDGDDAKDFDDAISIEKIVNGYRLYVHIADVSAYVSLNSAIDIEARLRGTSVYFPSNVFPMLPEKLCNNLCSLRPGEKKAALTCAMDIDFTGKVVSHRLEETFITSAERMTYANVTKILNGDVELTEKYSSIHEMLLNMQKLANILSEKRFARGAINFLSKEMKVLLNEKNEIIDLVKSPYDESNSIIEEFMLIANETVAEHVYHTAYPFVYRVHEVPLEEKIDTLKDFLSGCDIIIKDKVVRSSQFAEILEKVKGTAVEGIVNKVMLRSMCKARYDDEQGEHFGLAAEYYCHFTSPIRRYPDLTIHRIIKDIINGKMNEKRVQMYIKLTEEVAKSSTERERAAELAEREIDDYYKAMFMSKHIGEAFDGIISGVTNFGIFVELENTIEGLIALDELQGFGYTLDQKKYTLSNGTTTYRLGDKIKIVVESTDEDSRRIRFTIFKEGGEEKSLGDKTLIKTKSDKRIFSGSSGSQRTNGNSSYPRDNRRNSSERKIYPKIAEGQKPVEGKEISSVDKKPYENGVAKANGSDARTAAQKANYNRTGNQNFGGKKANGLSSSGKKPYFKKTGNKNRKGK